MISFIVAMDKNRVIGKDNAIAMAFTRRFKVFQKSNNGTSDCNG